MRRVGGYNIDALTPERRNAPGGTGNNLAHLLVGSEGTLAFSTRVHIGLQPIPKHKTLGICHFPTFYKAMASAPHNVKLDQAAVELVDRTMIEPARDIPIFRRTTSQPARGRPEPVPQDEI